MRDYNGPQRPKHYQSYSSPVSAHYLVINESPGEVPRCVTHDQQCEIPLTTKVIHLFKNQEADICGLSRTVGISRKNYSWKKGTLDAQPSHAFDFS